MDASVGSVVTAFALKYVCARVGKIQGRSGDDDDERVRTDESYPAEWNDFWRQLLWRRKISERL